MSIVTITRRLNAARFGLSEKQLNRLLPETTDRMMKEAARKTVMYLKRQTRAKRIVAFGKFLENWRYRKSGSRTYLVLNDTPYAKFAESGRGPGRPPPVAALKPWAALKLGNPDLAYPLAKKIGREGTTARNRFVSSGTAYDTQLRKILEDAARSVVGAALKKMYR